MSETIRKQIEDILASYGLMDGEPGMASLLTDELGALFPQWQTFSETCKPEETGVWINKNKKGEWFWWRGGGFAYQLDEKLAIALVGPMTWEDEPRKVKTI